VTEREISESDVVDYKLALNLIREASAAGTSSANHLDIPH